MGAKQRRKKGGKVSCSASHILFRALKFQTPSFSPWKGEASSGMTLFQGEVFLLVLWRFMSVLGAATTVLTSTRCSLVLSRPPDLGPGLKDALQSP